ncbi:MAG: UvrD-helicase domain-containing protein [Patescibacteria group bacterium]
MDLTKGLNEPQKKAVLHTQGPLLVIAGAGAGKTTVITHRIANLIQSKTARPEQILAVTFTNKAANEMKERIFKLLKSNFDSKTTEVGFPCIGTFHAICTRILRENGQSTGLPRNFSILDKEDSLKILKKCFKTLEINPKQFQPTKILSVISKQKSNLVDLKKFTDKSGDDFFPNTVASIWREYEKHLSNQKSADFDDLIAKVVFLFQKKPDILEKYQNRWLYILIDEYQDTNHSQYVLSKLLAKKHKNICAVGDEDQSIYKFRGADFGNILNFEKDWPGTETIMLEQNYRSTQNILEAANAIISKNKLRKPKNLFSELKKGEGLTIFDAQSEKEESDFVAITSDELIRTGVNPDKIAVLYRANFQSRIIEEAFLNRDIPYHVIGTKFFERKEVKDIVGYIKAGLNPSDIISLERIINEPPRGLGKASLLNHLANHPSTPLRARKLKDFFEFLEKINKRLQTEKLSKIIPFIIKESGYAKHLQKGTEEDMMRADNLKELVLLSVKYDALEPLAGIEKFLEDVSLMSDQDTVEDRKKAVRLMTVHAAKGLEFSNVFIVGLEDGLFPYVRFGAVDDEEEERRLFYVAVTRAKQKLFLSFAHSRTVFGGRQMNSPSRFINEIPVELFEQGFENLPTTNYLDF